MLHRFGAVVFTMGHIPEEGERERVCVCVLRALVEAKQHRKI